MFGGSQYGVRAVRCLPHIRWRNLNTGRRIQSNGLAVNNGENTEQAFEESLVKDVKEQLELDSTADVLRRVFLGPQATSRPTRINQKLYKFHFKDLRPHARPNASQSGLRQDDEVFLERSGAPSDPKYYRLRAFESLPTSSAGLGMELLRSQFYGCVTAEDFTRVFTTAFKTNSGAIMLANPSFQRKISMNMADRLKPQRVLECLNVLITRLEMVGKMVENETIWFALICAAKVHNPTAIRHYLKKYINLKPQPQMEHGELVRLVRALLHGVRNAISYTGSVPQSEAMFQILYGFNDSAFRGPYNVFALVSRVDWPLLSGLLPLLQELGEVNGLELVTQMLHSQSEHKPLESLRDGPDIADAIICAYFARNQSARAWDFFKTYGQLLNEDHWPCWDLLFETSELKPQLEPILQKLIGERFTQRLDNLMTMLERSLAVEWVRSSDDPAMGNHIPQHGASLQVMLSQLADPQRAAKQQATYEQRKAPHDRRKSRTTLRASGIEDTRNATEVDAYDGATSLQDPQVNILDVSSQPSSAIPARPEFDGALPLKVLERLSHLVSRRAENDSK